MPEAALEEAGLSKETILAAIPMDGVVLVTKDSMPIVKLLQMLDRLNLYAAEMLTAVAAECGPCEKADEALTVEAALEECKVTPGLEKMVLVNNSRLSVQPVSPEEWVVICRLGGVEP